MKKKIVIGTRGSKLALVQSTYVMERLKKEHSELEVELKVIKTTGDKILNRPLNKIGGKALFIKEIEEALAAGEVDIAVHSMKDVPYTLPQGFILGAVLQREDPRDVLISAQYPSLDEIPADGVIGTSSLRRKVQLKEKYPHLKFVPLRGNIDSRIQRMQNGDFDGIILAAAGLHRLGWAEKITSYIDINDCIPAVGQGALAIEIREEDQEILQLIAPLHDSHDNICVKAERAFLQEVAGSCSLPVGAYAQIQKDTMCVKAILGEEDTDRFFRREITGSAAEGEELGRILARELLANRRGDTQ